MGNDKKKGPPVYPFPTPKPDPKYRSRVDLVQKKRRYDTVPYAKDHLPPKPTGRGRARSASPLRMLSATPPAPMSRGGSTPRARGRNPTENTFHINPHVDVQGCDTPRGRRQVSDGSKGMWTVLASGPPVTPPRTGRRTNSEGAARCFDRSPIRGEYRDTAATGGKAGKKQQHPLHQSSLVCTGGLMKPGKGEGELRTGEEDTRGPAGMRKGDGAFKQKHRNTEFDITIQERAEWSWGDGAPPAYCGIRTGYAAATKRGAVKEDNGKRSHPDFSERYSTPRSCNPNRTASRPRPSDAVQSPCRTEAQFRAKYLQHGKKRSHSANVDHFNTGGVVPKDPPPFVPQKRRLASPHREERVDPSRPPTWKVTEPRPRLLGLKKEDDKAIIDGHKHGKSNYPVYGTSSDHRRYYHGANQPPHTVSMTDKSSLRVVRENIRSASPASKRRVHPPEPDQTHKHAPVMVHPPNPREANHLRLPNAQPTDAEKAYKPGQKTTVVFPNERGKKFWHPPNEPPQAKVNTDAASLMVTRAPYRTEWGAPAKPRYVLPESPNPVVSSWERRIDSHNQRYSSGRPSEAGASAASPTTGGYGTSASRSQTVQVQRGGYQSNPQQQREINRLRQENDDLLSRLRAFRA